MGLISRLKNIISSKKRYNEQKDYKEAQEDIVNRVEELVKNIEHIDNELEETTKEHSNAEKLLNSCKTEIASLQKYAEKAVKLGNDDDASKFLEQKHIQENKLTRLQAMYDNVHENYMSLIKIHNKMAFEINELKTRNEALKDKMVINEYQKKYNDFKLDSDQNFDDILSEEEITTKIQFDEAKSVEELNDMAEAGKIDIKCSVADEITLIKQKQGKQQ